MSLSKSRTAEKEERVEGCLARSSRDALACSEAHLVALAYYEVFKAIYRIELRVDLNSLYSWENKRTRISSA